MNTESRTWRPQPSTPSSNAAPPGFRRVEPPMTPAGYSSHRKEHFDLPLIASLQPGSRHAREYFASIGRVITSPHSICIWVGPEGDFTPEEIAAAESAAHCRSRLGRLVLRSETAAISCPLCRQLRNTVRSGLIPTGLDQHAKCSPEMLRMRQRLKLPRPLPASIR